MTQTDVPKSILETTGDAKTLENAATIFHDGTYDSSEAVKRWAGERGFLFISTLCANGDSRSNIVCIGKYFGEELNSIHLRAGDRAFVLGGKLVKDWWREEAGVS